MVELKQSPGAPCDNYNGYCDVFLKCRKVDADGPLARLKNMFFSKEAIMGYIEWIETYWWAVVLMGVGLILLMAGKLRNITNDQNFLQSRNGQLAYIQMCASV